MLDWGSVFWQNLTKTFDFLTPPKTNMEPENDGF